MIYIGIDPGLSGGLAIISTDGIETLRMPVVSQGKKNIYDHPQLRLLFQRLYVQEPYAILEEQHAMPKQGVTSMFSIGYGFGALKQCLVDFTIPHEVVRAKEWQKAFGITGKKGSTKTQSIAICKRLFPDVNLLPTSRSRKDSDGLADATLIAEFARRRYMGGDVQK